MGRRTRLFLPGAPFHVTARLQDGERLFTGVEQRVVSTILRTAALERTSIVAYAVMPNHIHLLAIHGPRPLATLMQPLLRRLALLIQQRYHCRGHVFERRYREHVCLDPDYARNIVAYVHLNPVRAGLCADPAGYPWTSHGVYCRGIPAGDSTALFDATVAAFLGVFAERPATSIAQWRRNYRDYVAWRISADRAHKAGLPDPAPPRFPSGDMVWRERFWGSPAAAPGPPAAEMATCAGTGLEDLANAVIMDADHDVSVDLLRTNRKIPADVTLRRKLILHALAAGYSGHQIARYLRITTSAVSKVRTAALAASISDRDE